MKRACKSIVSVVLIALTGCGGGGGGYGHPGPSGTYDLQAGYANLVNSGLTTNVALSGTVLVNGVSTPFTGTGTLTLAAAVPTVFNNTSALAQNETVSGTVMAAGQSAAYSTDVTDYYASASGAFLGQVSANEYDLVQSPLTFPTSVVGGSSGVLGTVSRYADSTMGVVLGTAQISYFVADPIDPGSPVQVQITDKIYDTQNTLIETDVTTYTLNTASDLSFVSATAQTTSGNVSVTAQ